MVCFEKSKEWAFARDASTYLCAEVRNFSNLMRFNGVIGIVLGFAVGENPFKLLKIYCLFTGLPMNFKANISSGVIFTFRFLRTRFVFGSKSRFSFPELLSLVMVNPRINLLLMRLKLVDDSGETGLEFYYRLIVEKNFYVVVLGFMVY